MRNTALLALLLSACIAAWATEPAQAETSEGRWDALDPRFRVCLEA